MLNYRHEVDIHIRHWAVVHQLCQLKTRFSVISHWPPVCLRNADKQQDHAFKGPLKSQELLCAAVAPSQVDQEHLVWKV